MIHPIIIYPYSHPDTLQHLKALYIQLVARLEDNKRVYARPLTVINNQTCYRNQDDKDFIEFQNEYVKKYSDTVNTWSVDTCQMWLAGFGAAYDKEETDKDRDVFWLIPGDFDYSTTIGKEVLEKFEEIPVSVSSGQSDLCLGEISIPASSPKQLIDTYGTYGLLYNWFPLEAYGIHNITDKPRSEFFAINADYLRMLLIEKRWYAYEQTIVILLEGMKGKKPMKKIKKIDLGKIIDAPYSHNSLESAMQQVERMERVLKLYWREYHKEQNELDWPEKFRQLDLQSEQIRSAAMVIFQHAIDKQQHN